MTKDKSPLLSVRDLRVEFRQLDSPLAVAIENLSFDLAIGESLAVLGESGSGKTATAMAIAGLLPPYARITGSVILNGIQLLECPERIMRRIRGQEIGYIFQEPSSALNPVLAVGDQVAEAARVHGKPAKLAKHNALSALSSAGFPDAQQRYSSYPHEFSGGLRQRACIAMAVVNRPKLLIADEPTSALDVSVQSGIIDLLGELRRGFEMSLIFITHDLKVAARVASRGLVLYAGRPVEMGPMEELVNQPLHPYTQALLKSMPELGSGRGRLHEIAGSVPSATEELSGCRFAPRCNRADDVCRRQTPDFEEYIPGCSVACHHAGKNQQGLPPIPEIQL